MSHQRLDTRAVLGRRIDAARPAALMHRPAAACRAHQAVLGNLRAQHGQLKDLAPVNHLVRAPLALADRASGGAAVMGDDFIDLRALAQGIAFMSLLPAHGALAFETQRLGRRLGQPIARGRLAGVAAVELQAPFKLSDALLAADQSALSATGFAPTTAQSVHLFVPD